MIFLDGKMKVYMQENGYKDIVLGTESKLCTTCTGFNKKVTLRFADEEEEEELMEAGYVSGESERRNNSIYPAPFL